MGDSTVKVIDDQIIQCQSETIQSINQPWLLGPFDHLLVSHVVTVESVFVYQSIKATPIQSINHQSINDQSIHDKQFPDQSINQSPVICPDRLHRSLCRLLDFYPHLTGRFSISSLDKTPEINRLNTGALYRTAKCDQTLESFRPINASTNVSNNQSESASNSHSINQSRLTILDLPGEGSSLWCPFDISIEAISSNPILTIQHTTFACGSVSLGIRVHHWVCDAEGFFLLVAHLSEVYEKAIDGVDCRSITLASPPIINSFMAGTYQQMRADERDAALSYQPKFFRSKSSTRPAQPTTQSSDPSENIQAVTEKQAFSLNSTAIQAPIVGRVLRFSAPELKAIKNDAMSISITQSSSQPSASSTSQSNNQWVSTFEALTAHLHHRVFVARAKLAQSANQPVDQLVTDILMPINFRAPNRLNLSNNQPNGYFPNADIPVFMSFEPDRLLDQSANQSIAEVAHAIHSLTRELQPDDVVSTLKWLSAHDNKQSIYQAFRFPGGFMVTQWNKMNMYKGMLFNNQSPILVSKPFTVVSLLDGFAHFMATEEQIQYSDPAACGIDVIMSVSESVWRELDQDGHFRRHATAAD